MWKRDSCTGVFLWIYEIFKDRTEHLLAIDSDWCLLSILLPKFLLIQSNSTWLSLSILQWWYRQLPWNQSELNWCLCRSSRQKQPFIGVFIKRYSENIQQIYKGTPMLKCDFNKIALQLFWYRTSVWTFSGKLVAYF